jgi:hypothetical protein
MKTLHLLWVSLVFGGACGDTPERRAAKELAELCDEITRERPKWDDTFEFDGKLQGGIASKWSDRSSKLAADVYLRYFDRMNEEDVWLHDGEIPRPNHAAMLSVEPSYFMNLFKLSGADLGVDYAGCPALASFHASWASGGVHAYYLRDFCEPFAEECGYLAKHPMAARRSIPPDLFDSCWRIVSHTHRFKGTIPRVAEVFRSVETLPPAARCAAVMPAIQRLAYASMRFPPHGGCGALFAACEGLSRSEGD